MSIKHKKKMLLEIILLIRWAEHLLHFSCIFGYYVAKMTHESATSFLSPSFPPFPPSSLSPFLTEAQTKWLKYKSRCKWKDYHITANIPKSLK